MGFNHVYIIAEAGVNHNGDLEIAKRLIEVAAEAGCDSVKFQTFKPENLVSKYAEQAEYQKKNTGKTESQLEMLKKFVFTEEEHKELMLHCEKCGIQFLSTPFDFESIEMLYRLGMRTFKIPSGEITNLPYLEKVNSLGVNVILSTGMSEITEVRDALKALESCKIDGILHCTTDYPTNFSDVNLNAMLTLGNEFNMQIGYSDHTLGIEIPVAAVALGAKIIEKHITLDNKMEGPDHLASLEPNKLKEMVGAIRNVEMALGDGVKKPADSEKKNIGVARKSIVAKARISKGEVFTEENLTVKRPGNGISPMRWHEILGKTATKDYEEDFLIDESL